MLHNNESQEIVSMVNDIATKQELIMVDHCIDIICKQMPR